MRLWQRTEMKNVVFSDEKGNKLTTELSKKVKPSNELDGFKDVERFNSGHGSQK